MIAMKLIALWTMLSAALALLIGPALRRAADVQLEPTDPEPGRTLRLGTPPIPFPSHHALSRSADLTIDRGSRP